MMSLPQGGLRATNTVGNGWDDRGGGGKCVCAGGTGSAGRADAGRNDVHGDVVIGSGTWKMTIPTPGGHQVMEGRFSDVKAMRDGQWVFVMDHASVPLPPPPPAK